MKLCIPITEDQGLRSPVSAHFGSAPMFMVVNTDTDERRVLPNRNLDHQHGNCRPMASIDGEGIEAMVVGGIGGGALNGLMANGIKVFLAEHPTVELTLEAFKSGSLQPVAPGHVCPHHHGGGRGGCGNGHGQSKGGGCGS